MQGIAQYTLPCKVWALRGDFCRWQKNNQRSLTLPMIINKFKIAGLKFPQQVLGWVKYEIY